MSPTPLSTNQVGKYYVHSPYGDENIPLVDSTESSPLRRRALLQPPPLDRDMAPYRFTLGSPRPKKPVMADLLYNQYPIISDKIKDALEPFLGRSAECFPAQVETKKRAYPYWLVHSLQDHDVLDCERSEFNVISTGAISWIDKMFLDEDRLGEIRLEDRYLFKLGRSSVVYLWHEDVVLAVEATGPTGIRFFPAEGFGQDLLFSA